MSSVPVGQVVDGASTGAQTGFQYGGPWGAAIGAVIGGVTGGVFGSRSAKKRKTAERLVRENQAIQRMQGRKNAIVNAIQEIAVASAASYSGGYNPEGTSADVGVRNSIYSQIQSNLKTESMQYNRNVKIAKLTKQADKYDNVFAMLKSAAQTAGAAKGMMGGKGGAMPSSMDMSSLPQKRTDTSGFVGPIMDDKTNMIGRPRTYSNNFMGPTR